jgi:hypothetical protein
MPRNLVNSGTIIAAGLKREDETLSLIDDVRFRRIVPKLKVEIPSRVDEHVRKSICSAVFGYQTICDNENAPARDNPLSGGINRELLSISRPASKLAAKLTGLSTSAEARIHAVQEIVDDETQKFESVKSSLGSVYEMQRRGWWRSANLFASSTNNRGSVGPE